MILALSLTGCFGKNSVVTETSPEGVVTTIPVKVYVTNQVIGASNQCMVNAMALRSEQETVGDNVSEKTILKLDASNQGTALMGNVANNILRVMFEMVPKPKDMFSNCMMPLLAHIESEKVKALAIANMWQNIINGTFRVITGAIIVDAIADSVAVMARAAGPKIAADGGSTVTYTNGIKSNIAQEGSTIATETYKGSNRVDGQSHLEQDESLINNENLTPAEGSNVTQPASTVIEDAPLLDL